jgi:hypothetical protein
VVRGGLRIDPGRWLPGARCPIANVCSISYTFLRYIEYLVENLRTFLATYGNDGKDELNALCEHHRITIVPDDTGKVNYSGCDIKGGVFRILFAAHHLGTNAYDATRYLHEAFLRVPPRAGQKMNLIARNSILTDYLPGIEAVRVAIADILDIPDIKLTANFEENYAALAGSRDVLSGWEKNLGAFSLAYFAGLQGTLEYERFAGDAMMQEGFLDVVSGKEASLRIVKKLVKGTYNEAVVEGGVLYLQVSYFVVSASPPQRAWNHAHDLYRQQLGIGLLTSMMLHRI